MPVLKALRHGACPRLARLDLSDHHFNDEGVTHLATALAGARLPKLNILELEAVDVAEGEVGAAALAKPLRSEAAPPLASLWLAEDRS